MIDFPGVKGLPKGCAFTEERQNFQLTMPIHQHLTKLRLALIERESRNSTFHNLLH